jgi:hypothetical protein
MQTVKLGAPWKYASCLEKLVLQALQYQEWDICFILSGGTAASQIMVVGMETVSETLVYLNDLTRLPALQHYAEQHKQRPVFFFLIVVPPCILISTNYFLQRMHCLLKHILQFVFKCFT